MHEHLWSICKKMPEDYEPYGKAERKVDCSWGCVYYFKLADHDGMEMGNDWGVCANPDSHRVGLLTFEHQGCRFATGKWK